MYILNACADKPYRPAGQFRIGLRQRRKVSYFRYLIHLARSHHTDVHSRTHRTTYNSYVGNGPLIRIKNGVKNQTLQRFFTLIFRSRNLFYNPFKDLIHPKAGLSTDFDSI